MRNTKQFVISCLILSGLIPAWAASPPVAPVKIDKSVNTRARLNDDVLRLSQPLKCKADGDCVSIALGVKPCGGPWKYILYSKKNPKVPLLKKKVAEYNQVDQKINESQQMMSDCSKTLEPIPKCANSMCIDGQDVSGASAPDDLEKITPAPPPHPVRKTH
jgi:hypothetical protein